MQAHHQPKSFADIKAMLQAHIDVLKQHTKYIREIADGKISNEDIIDYVNELFNVRIKRDGDDKDHFIKKFKTEYLPELKSTIEGRYGIYLQMFKISIHPDERVAISALALAFEYELFYAKLDERALKMGAPLRAKMLLAVSGIDFLRANCDAIKKLLPPLHSELKETISLDTIEPHKKDNKAIFAHARFGYSWLKLKNRILNSIGKLMKFKTDDTTKPNFKAVMGDHSTVSLIDGWQEHIDRSIAEATANADIASVEVIMMNSPNIISRIDTQHAKFVQAKNAQLVGNEDARLLSFMFENVNAFYEIYPEVQKTECSISHIQTVSNIARSESKRVHGLKFRFDKMAQSVTSEMRALYDMHGEIIKLSAAIDNEEEHRVFIINMLDAIRACDQFARVFSKPFTLTTNIREVENAMVEYKAAYSESLASINEYKAAIKRYLQAKEVVVEVIKTEQPRLEYVGQEESSSDACKPEVPSTDLMRAALLEEAKRKNQEYKASVERKRHEKEMSARPRIAAAVAPVTTVSIFKNEAVELRLNNLNKNGLLVLCSLFNFEKNVHYDSVCRVITDQLGGSIEEIGNGSSHKRTRLNKYFIEITAHEGFEISEKQVKANSVATGGTFFQHGGAHQSGVMKRFNMELIVNTLIKAGITKELIDGLIRNQIEYQNLSN